MAISSSTVCDSEEHNFYQYGLLWLEAASLYRPTYDTESISFMRAVVNQWVFSLSLCILLPGLSPGHPHSSFPQAAVTSGTAWWGHISWKAKEEERKEYCWQAKGGGSVTQGFRLCSLHLAAAGLWHASAFLMKTTLCSFIFPPLYFSSTARPSVLPGQPRFITCRSHAFDSESGMILHFSLEEDIVLHQCYFILKQGALITAAEFVNFLLIK